MRAHEPRRGALLQAGAAKLRLATIQEARCADGLLTDYGAQ